MNKQGRGKIDWCNYSWNPISGCLHGCHYCYMRRMEKRFKGIMSPAYHPVRLCQPMLIKRPSLVFTGSSGDMWGKWVDPEWIDNVLNVCSVVAPWHIYQFLTKNPKRYKEFKPLANCWYGTTDDGSERTRGNSLKLVSAVSEPRRFISFEPLLTCRIPDLFGIQWVIIGADSTKGAEKPPKGWADIIIGLARKQHIPVFVKDNYNYPDRIKEMPNEYIV